MAATRKPPATAANVAERRTADQSVWMEIGKLQATDKLHDADIAELKAGMGKLQAESTTHTEQLAHIDDKLEGIPEAVAYFREAQKKQEESEERIRRFFAAMGKSLAAVGSGLGLIFGTLLAGTLSRLNNIPTSTYITAIAIMIAIFLIAIVRIFALNFRKPKGGTAP